VKTSAESLIVRGGKYPCQRYGADWPGEDARRSMINYWINYCWSEIQSVP
jgi:hypothetical protein